MATRPGPWEPPGYSDQEYGLSAGSNSGPSGSEELSDAAPQKGQGGQKEPGKSRKHRDSRARCSVRQRNNRRVQSKKDTARITKRIQVRCLPDSWDRLLHSFGLAPLLLGKGDQGQKTEWAPTVACLQIRSPDKKNPPCVEVGGIHIGCRWVRNGKAGYWDGDQLDLSTLGIQRSLLEPCVHPRVDQQRYERIVDGHVRERLAREGFAVLGFITSVKLKVELFETKLPAMKTDAPAIHSYAGPAKNRELYISIPPYVPHERFLDLNAQAQCWIAKTMVERGIVLTTHYHVGPDHCFMPNETIFFRNNTQRFQKPVWVISPEEAQAFAVLGEDFLVKRTLKRGDRFVLIPAFDRRKVFCSQQAHMRPHWWMFQEEEPVTNLLEPRDGWVITDKTAKHFALEGPGKTVKVTHCDCTILTLQVASHAIVGMPLEREKRSGNIPIQADDPRRLPPVEHYMDLRNRLGFNAMGLLHDPDLDSVLVECPLNRLSVMSPTSRLLFLDHWRDEQEQKAFMKFLERIQDLYSLGD